MEFREFRVQGRVFRFGRGGGGGRRSWAFARSKRRGRVALFGSRVGSFLAIPNCLIIA